MRLVRNDACDVQPQRYTRKVILDPPGRGANSDPSAASVIGVVLGVIVITLVACVFPYLIMLAILRGLLTADRRIRRRSW